MKSDVSGVLQVQDLFIYQLALSLFYSYVLAPVLGKYKHFLQITPLFYQISVFLVLGLFFHTSFHSSVVQCLYYFADA